MKCKYCSGPVTMEDEYCPFCGALNEPAREHIEAMKRYNADYNMTKDEVLFNAEKQGKRHSFIITVGILVCLNVLLLFFQSDMYRMEELVTWFDLKLHSAEYHEQMDAYEAAGDYEQLSDFNYAKNLYYSKDFREYDYVIQMSNYIVRIRRSLYYLTNEDVNGYRSKNDLLETIADCMEGIYDSMDYMESRDSSYTKDMRTPVHLNTMEKICSEAETLIKGYFDVTEEEIEKMKEMESTETMIFLGKKGGYYE